MSDPVVYAIQPPGQLLYVDETIMECRIQINKERKKRSPSHQAFYRNGTRDQWFKVLGH